MTVVLVVSETVLSMRQLIVFEQSILFVYFENRYQLSLAVVQNLKPYCWATFCSLRQLSVFEFLIVGKFNHIYWNERYTNSIFFIRSVSVAWLVLQAYKSVCSISHDILAMDKNCAVDIVYIFNPYIGGRRKSDAFAN